jgi:hypothetical protein
MPPKITGKTRKAVRASKVTKKKSLERYSNFFITINPNKAAKNDEEFEEMNERLAEALDDLFGTSENLDGYVLDFLVDNASFEDDILDVKFLTQIEEGSKKHRIHSHTILEITHKTKIRISIDGIKRYFADKGIAPNVYVHVDIVPDNLRHLLQYVGKTQENLEEGELEEAFKKLYI